MCNQSTVLTKRKSIPVPLRVRRDTLSLCESAEGGAQMLVIGLVGELEFLRVILRKSLR